MLRIAHKSLNILIVSALFGLGAASALAAPVSLAKDFEYTTLSLDADRWDIETNGTDSDDDPEFIAHFDSKIELDLGELATIPFITGDPDDMLDAYESNLKGVFHIFDRQKRLPTGFTAPKGYTCRSYRGAMFEGSEPDSTDITCYAPYSGGARTMQIEIKDGSDDSHLKALQQAVDGIRLSA
ncbi:hypothetical protein C7S18_19255 [Ahniella affigens]|uniref:Uncharacterized protein n=1 Tax=Ahniella affigens TaxID=2021234 RepID=A0A2P1PWG3_9GAMM|nr:hypothetical protein C7S18_19255 [Ahniella affigens]